MRHALLALLLTTPLVAQDCPDNITLAECFDRFAPSTLHAKEAAAVTERAAENEAEDVAEATTGTPTIDSFAGNATRDFLALFAAALQTANLTEENDALTLEYNLRLDEESDPVKIQAVVRKPTLWEPFKKTVTDAADQEKLMNTLDDRDDITINLSWSREGKRFGRHLASHRDIFNAIMSTVPRRVLAPSMDDVDALIQRLGEEGVKPFDELAETDTIKFEHIKDPVVRELVRQAVMTAAKQTRDLRKEFDDAIAAAGVDKFSELLNNQPQFYLAGSARERDDLVGPNEKRISLTYEHGFTNLNKFRAKHDNVCPTDPDACAAAFKTFVEREDIEAGLESANRFALTFGHTWVDEYDITPEGMTAFHVDGGTTTSGSLAYARILHQSGQDRDGRIDAQLTYENVTGDADKDNRWIGSIIYTQKLTDTLSLPIGVVWANHEKDVPESDERLSAHFGLVFKLPNIMP